MRAGIQSKDPHRAVEVIVRDVRRDGDLSKRRGACHRRVRWNVRQSRRSRRGGRRGKTVLRKRRLALLVVLLLPALGLHMPDLVAVEALLVHVGVRLGVSLVLVILELGLPFAILALSVFAP